MVKVEGGLSGVKGISGHSGHEPTTGYDPTEVAYYVWVRSIETGIRRFTRTRVPYGSSWAQIAAAAVALVVAEYGGTAVAETTGWGIE